MKKLDFLHGVLLLVACFSAVASEEQASFPSLRDLLVGARDILLGTYQLSSKCNLTLSLSQDECTYNVTAGPSGCATPQALLNIFLGSNSDAISDLMDVVPKNISVEGMAVDKCVETFSMTMTSGDEYDIIPDVVSVQHVQIRVDILLPTMALIFTMRTEWCVGDIGFTMTATRRDGRVVIEGRPNPPSRQFSIGEMVNAIGKKVAPGSVISGPLSKLGLNAIRLRDVVLTAMFNSRGYAFRFAFRGMSSILKNPYLQITVNYLKAERRPGVTIAGSFQELDMANTFKRFTDIDISTVPFVGKTKFSQLNMVLSTQELGEPLLQYSVVGLRELSPIRAGIQLSSDIKFSPPSNATRVQIVLSKKKVLFHLVGESVSVSGFIDRLISRIGDINLPPKFSLKSFLDVRLSSFEYDSATRVFSLPVIVPDKTIFVPHSIELYDTSLFFQIKTGSGGKVGFEMSSVWHLGKYAIPLKITKSHEMQHFQAISAPQFDLPFGEMIKQFAVALLPSGSLENAVKKLGLESFYIKKPAVKVIFAKDMVLKVRGTTVIGLWDKCNVEVLLGQVGGAFVMVTGIEFKDVPITRLISDMTYNKINLATLPGASILDSTDAAVTMSPQNVPKAQKFMQFSLTSLNDTEILDGVTVVAAFKFPTKCKKHDQGCLVAKRFLGANARLILKGRLYIASVQLSAVIPAEIQVFRGVNITDCGLEVEFGTRNAIGIKGTLKLKEPDLTFIGSFGLSSSGVYLQMAMKGMWRKPFGIPNLAIGDIILRVAIIPDPILLSAIEFGGKAQIGLFDNPKATPLKAAMYIGIDRVSPFENYFYGSVSPLTIPSILKAFAYSPLLPPPLKEIGFPEGLLVSYALKTKLLPNGVSISRGFFLQGVIKVLFFEAKANIRLNLNGIFVDVWVKPFSIGKGLVEVSGRNSSVGPRIYVDIGWNPPRAWINIEGTIKVLGIGARTNLTVDHRGFSFSIQGNMLKLFEVELDITANYNSIQSADFMVAGRFHKAPLQQWMREVQKTLTSYRDAANRAISSAKSKINQAKSSFISASEKIRPLEDRVKSEKAKFDYANRKLESAKRTLDARQKDFNLAVAKLTSAQNSVRIAQGKFNDASRSMENKKRSCPNACRKRRTPEATFFVAAEANAVLKRRKRGWFKSPWEAAREAGERVNEKVRFRERAREVTCAGKKAARETCLAGLNSLKYLVSSLGRSLDAAKVALKGATAAVDQSRNLLNIAKSGLHVAQASVNAAKYTLDVAAGALAAARVTVSQSRRILDAATGTLEAVKQANNFGVRIGQEVSKLGLNGIIDIHELTFSVRLSVAQTGHFSGSMKATIMGSTRRFGFEIKLMSVKDMVDSLVKKVRTLVGLKRKRSITAMQVDIGGNGVSGRRRVIKKEFVKYFR